MSQSNPALTALFMKEFQWCKVKPGEAATVLTEPGSRQDYITASLTGLTALGARVFQIMLLVAPDQEGPSVINRGTGASTVLGQFPEVVELLQKTNMVVDLTVEGLIHSSETPAILKSGARVLHIDEPPDALARMLPTEDRTRRVDRSIELLKAAKEMTVTSEVGTKFRVDLAGALTRGAYGFCDRPGQFANWGAGGTVVAYSPSEAIDGDVVLAPGDIIFPFKKYVEGKVLLRFKRAFIEAIDGEGIDAALIRDYMERWQDRNGYGISHVGWGLNEKALWHALSFYGKEEASGVDGRAFEGNFLLSTGPNYAAGRHTLCHFDIPMRNCSIFLDGKPIIREGTIVEPTIKRGA